MIPLPVALTILRIAVALVFVLHAAVRIANGSMIQFTDFLAGKHWPAPLLTVWLLTLFELKAGIVLAAGLLVKPLAYGFILILLTGIVLVHAERGWFVGEHGTGGVEYSFILIVALLVTAAGDQPIKM